MVQLRPAHVAQQLRKILLGLPGESHDEVGADRHARNAAPERLDQPLHVRPPDLAPHAAKHRVGDVLERNVDILANLDFLFKHLDQRFAPGLGVGVVHPDPFDPLDPDQLAQELGQPRLSVEVGSVGRGVLRDQEELPRSPLGQPPGLRHHRFQGPAAEIPPERGDDAEGAPEIAAVRDPEIRHVARRGDGAVRRQVHGRPRRSDFEDSGRRGAEHAIHHAHDRVHLPGAEGGVDLGDLAAQLRVIALGEAAGDHETPGVPRLLLPRHLEDGVDRLLLGPVDERTGVDDDDVRLLGVGHASRDHDPPQLPFPLQGGHLEDPVDRLALRGPDEGARVHERDVGGGRIGGHGEGSLRQEPRHDLRIHQVLRAAERHERHARGRPV